MPDNRSISQLTSAEQTTSSDLFETAIPNGSNGYLSRKVSLDAIAQFIAKALQYSDLQTTAKTLIDAINEAASGGGGGASIEEMTQAEYNALTPEQKADGTLRAISDATTSISDIDDVNISSPADGDILAYDSTSSKWVNKELEADAIAYDNTASGMTATNVQAAIDEVCAVSSFTPTSVYGKFSFKAINGIKFLKISDPKGFAAEWTTLDFTLPKSMIPIDEVAVFEMRDPSSTYTVRVRIQTNGVVKIYNYGTDTGALNMTYTGCYI